MSEWQDISTAPRDGTVVDLWDRSYPFERIGRRVTSHWGHHSWLHGKPTSPKSWGDGDMNGPGPTPSHWKPLPEPPK